MKRKKKRKYRKQQGSTAGSKTVLQLIIYLEDNETEENKIGVPFRYP